MTTGTRDELVSCLADAIGAVRATPVTRVAVDGPPASGKTTLADDLGQVLRSRGHEVIRSSIDDFLRPEAVRYRRGVHSAEGCYVDAHDHDAVNRMLSDPRVTPPSPRSLDTNTAVLVFDGVFLLRPEFSARWDVCILVRASAAVTVARAIARGHPTLSDAALERRWRERYLPSQDLYRQLDRPTDQADIVIDNDEPGHPTWHMRST